MNDTIKRAEDQQRLDFLYNKVAKTFTQEQQEIVNEISKLEYDLERECNQ